MPGVRACGEAKRKQAGWGKRWSMSVDISKFKGDASEEAAAWRYNMAWNLNPLMRERKIEKTLLPISQCLAEALDFRADIIAELRRCNARIRELRSDQ